ncbi:unnamed protein product [Closterium sp. Naga37s-1]|nr:unnamed protein product [Closterium sp. Naga37s-1]
MVTEIAYEPLPEGLFTPLSPLSAASACSAASAAPALFSPDGHSARFFDSPGASSSASVSSASVLFPGASPSSSPAAHTFSSRHRRQSSASHATTPPLITSLQGDVPRSPPAPFRRRSHSFASLNTVQLQRKIHASPSPPMSPSLAPCFVRAEATETDGQGPTKVRPESGGASGAATAASTLAEARAARLSTSAAAATAANPGRTKIFASVPLNKPPYLSSPASTGYANCAITASTSLHSHAVAEAGVPEFPRWGSTKQQQQQQQQQLQQQQRRRRRRRQQQQQQQQQQRRQGKQEAVRVEAVRVEAARPGVARA